MSKGPEKQSTDRKLGEILIDLKFISELQLAEAIATQAHINASSQRKFKIGEILLFKKIISMQQLHDALRAQTSKAASIRKDVQVIKKKAELIKTLCDEGSVDLKETKSPERKTFLSFLTPKK